MSESFATKTYLAAALGLVGIIAVRVVHAPLVWGLLPAALLIGSGLAAISRGWFVGRAPTNSETSDSGLVGARICCGDSVFTITDYNPPAGVSTPAHDGWPIALTAVDDRGVLGALFLAYDNDGNLLQAATPGQPWTSAVAAPPAQRI